MTGLLIMLTGIAITWLCVWVSNDQPTPPGQWVPFDIKEPEGTIASAEPAVEPMPSRPWRRG